MSKPVKLSAIGRVHPWKGWQVQRKLSKMTDLYLMRVYRTRKEALETWPVHFELGVVKLVRVLVQEAK